MSDLSTILSTDCRGTITGFEGIELKITQRSWRKGDDESLIIAGELPARECIATQDGRGIDLSGWHQGEAGDDEWIFYERFSEKGREGHGWIHSGSRRLLQAG